MPRTILVVDDDPASCRLMAALFEADGFTVVAVHDGKSGLARAEDDGVELVILDLHLPDHDGIEILGRLRGRNSRLPVVMLTAHADLKTAVRAMQLGAHDYLTKPVDVDEVTLVVRRALETRALRNEVEDLRRLVGEGAALATQMGPSPEVTTVSEQVRTVAATSFSVLILGETGTGKELVAQAIHRQSDRRSNSFIAVDCGAIPETLLESELFGHEKGAFTGAERRKEGRFRIAEGGTVFLDEVGNLPLGLQAKLLRVLESRQLQAVGSAKTTPMDVRFVAATNDDLQARVTAGKFRADLYFRLAQYTISLPPLRARPADIAYLARRFLEEVSVELRRPIHEIAPDATAALERHPWPGNVRELRNVVRQAVLEARDVVLRRAHLQKFLGDRSESGAAFGGASAGRVLKEVAETAARDAEQRLIREVLNETRGNKSQAARILRTDYKTLHLKMKAFGIRARDYAQ
jgi:two-component system nitrogen regulation response regulator GlnG